MAFPRSKSQSVFRRASRTSRRVRTSRSRTRRRSCAQWRANLEPASSCNGAGAGQDRTASPSTISARMDASLCPAAASSPPMAFTSSQTPRTKRKGARTSGCSRRRANHGSALLGFGSRSKTSRSVHAAHDASGPDIGPYHDRQIAILDRADWAAWLDSSASAKTILKALPPGALTIQQVG
jgi:hypothetical protein